MILTAGTAMKIEPNQDAPYMKPTTEPAPIPKVKRGMTLDQVREIWQVRSEAKTTEIMAKYTQQTAGRSGGAGRARNLRAVPIPRRSRKSTTGGAVAEVSRPSYRRSDGQEGDAALGHNLSRCRQTKAPLQKPRAFAIASTHIP